MAAPANPTSNFAPNLAYALGRIKHWHRDRVGVVPPAKLNGATPLLSSLAAKRYLVFNEGEPGLVLLDTDSKGMPADVRHRMDKRGSLWKALCELLPALKNRRSRRAPSTRSGQSGRIPWLRRTPHRHPVSDAADAPRSNPNCRRGRCRSATRTSGGHERQTGSRQRLLSSRRRLKRHKATERA
jgi:hypothetical protein